MTPELEKEIKSALYSAILEQSEGEWDDSTIESDTQMFFNRLWEYFKDDS